MPRKSSTSQSSPLRVTKEYWLRFLESMNLIGEISEETETPEKPRTLLTPIVLAPDQMTFCYRVVERLTPIDGLDQDARRRALKIRQQMREELEGVFREKEDIKKWFTRTRQNFSLQEHELIEIMYEALEGLKSEQAKELKQQLQGAYNQIVRMRTIGLTG